MLIATWFGTGLLPWVPGSWGSLTALPFAWALQRYAGVGGLGAAASMAVVAGCWASGRVARASGQADPGGIVIDEVAAQWLVLLAAPRDLIAYGLAFALFRVFDILKPWPVNWVERRFKGGLGIMLDDIAAAGYAVVAFRLISAFVDVRP